MTFAAGAHPGPYEILAPLGAGGMGEVYRARDPRLHREVAIKVLPDLFAADTDRLARLEREARMLGALQHPRIAGIHGLEESEQRRFLVMVLSGRRTFAGESVSDTLAAVLRADPDWSRLPPALPASVHHLLGRCLEKDPRRRLHDIADARIEVEEALREIRGGRPGPAASATALPARAPRRAGRATSPPESRRSWPPSRSDAGQPGARRRGPSRRRRTQRRRIG